MATTTPLGMPYPTTADAPNGPAQIQALAAAAQSAIASVAAGLQEGVIDAGSFEVTQASGGASLVLDVASNVGSGCYVDDDGLSPARVARYYVPPTVSKSTVMLGAAHATLPRVDRVVVSMAGVVSAVAGTATSGATLDNLTGAAAVPADSLLLADALVPATDTTISNSQIRDRRKWARGAYRKIIRHEDAGASNDYDVNSSTFALIDAANIAPRIECSGVPVRVTLTGSFRMSSGTGTILVSPQVDSAGVDGMASVGDANTVGAFAQALGNGTPEFLTWDWEFTPAAGSHIIAPAWASDGSVFVFTRTDFPLLWRVEEILRADTANNATTSG